MTTSGPAAATSISELLKRGFEGFAGGTLEARVQELVDREEIRELAARYAQRVSRRQSMADMFTDDGAFIVRLPGHPVQEARGLQEVEKYFAATVTNPTFNMPAVHNQVISISGDEAIGTSWIDVYLKGDNGRTYLGSGYYEDRLRRENGRWKFVVRDANVLVMSEAHKGALDEKEAIRELLSSYCFSVDRGTPDDFANLFVEDCLWDGPAGKCESRQALREFATGAGVGSGEGKIRHLTVNEVISVTDDSATARSYVMGLNAADNPPSAVFTGFYEDMLVKTGGRWLFKTRIMKLK